MNAEHILKPDRAVEKTVSLPGPLWNLAGRIAEDVTASRSRVLHSTLILFAMDNVDCRVEGRYLRVNGDPADPEDLAPIVLDYDTETFERLRRAL